MTDRYGSAAYELPNDLDVLITRAFDAPINLVFDALTQPEHMSRWFPPSGCEMKECSIDLRVGGAYHQVFVTEDGAECSFRGTYLEIEPPTRTVETWVFEGRPHLGCRRDRGAAGISRGHDHDDPADVPRQGEP